MTAFFLDEDQTDVPPGLTAAVNRLLADPSASNAGEICAEIADIVTNAYPSVREIEIHADDLGEKFMMTVGLPELPEESGEKNKTDAQDSTLLPRGMQAYSYCRSKAESAD